MTTKGIGAQLWLFNQVHDEAALAGATQINLATRKK